jgi:predicted Zn-dependent protease
MGAKALEEAGTIAEALGMTGELAEAIARVAEDELDAGRPDPARVILEGLVVANPRWAGGWRILARAHRALGQPLAARFCAEVAATVDPGTAASRLARAEGLLPFPEEREQARTLLASLATEPCESGDRARGLLAAIGGARPGERDRSSP